MAEIEVIEYDRFKQIEKKQGDSASQYPSPIFSDKLPKRFLQQHV
jgi:hypothetical protein